MSEILSIPLKQTGDVDLVKPIKSAISSTRSINSNETHSLNELQNLRNKMVSAIKNQQNTDLALRDMQNYFDQIGNLEGKIPFSSLKIYFKWLDAFDKGSWLGGSAPYTMSTNLLYEKACVLFNIAALSTQIGSIQDLSTEEGLKKAVKMFQSAAGIFTAVSTPPPSSSSEQKPTADLNPECAEALSSLCLSQAQEVVLLKAMSDRKKDGIIAKLAKHAENLFETTGGLMSKEAAKAVLDRNWMTVVVNKQNFYAALVQFHTANVCKSEKKVGEEISRMTLARELFVKSGHPEREKYLQLSEAALEIAKKDNEFIYFEKVPSADELSIIEAAAVVKSIQLPEKFLPEEKNLFNEMIILDSTAKKADCILS